MKKITYVCNICDEDEVTMKGFEFDEDDELEEITIDIADIHICNDCIIAIKNIKTNEPTAKKK